MPVALTNIRHGNEDGTITTVEAGDPVDELPEDVIDQLREIGSVGDEFSANDQDKIERLQAEIEDLRRSLAEAKGEEPPTTPGQAAENLLERDDDEISDEDDEEA